MSVEMHPVKSSNISHVGYDSDNRELHVKFLTGKTYVHGNVEPHHHFQMMDTASSGGSIGRHYNAHFRENDQHPHRPLEGDSK